MGGMDLLAVRRSEAKDVEVIASICSDGWRQTYKDILPQSYIEEVIADYYSLERVSKECAENTPYFHGYWVAEMDGQVVGCIGGGIDQENAGHIYVFYVRPELKRQGVGSALLKEFTAYQKSSYGIKEQWVSFLTEGNHIGHAFYEKNGFVLDFVTDSQDPSHDLRKFHLKRSV